MGVGTLGSPFPDEAPAGLWFVVGALGGTLRLIHGFSWDRLVLGGFGTLLGPERTTVGGCVSVTSGLGCLTL